MERSATYAQQGYVFDQLLLAILAGRDHVIFTDQAPEELLEKGTRDQRSATTPPTFDVPIYDVARFMWYNH